MKLRLALLASSVLLAAPLMALARDAFTVDDVNLQAGPDEEYPTITQLPAGVEVAVQGCIDGWTWCDVVADGDRGWVPASYLEEEYNNQRVLVVDYGPRIGIPVVGFSLGAYWGSHYHNRPWYHERASWESRHIRPRALPRPTQASRGGADWRAHADLRSGEHHHDEANRYESNRYDASRNAANRTDINRNDVNRNEVTRTDANRRDDSRAERYRNDAERSRQTATIQQQQQRNESPVGGAARTSQQTAPTQTAAQSDAHAQAQSRPQYEQDGALGPSRQMPPQVQTARNNTPPANAAQGEQRGQQQHARDNRHDNGEHRGEHKGDKDGNDHDRDRG